MSKKTKNRIGLFLFTILLVIISAITFAQQKEAPNQLITDNPYKEVKTVTADKNREHAEMNISVRKINIEEIIGVKRNNDAIFCIPQEKNKSVQNEEYIVVKSLDEVEKIKKEERNVIKLDSKIIDGENNKFIEVFKTNDMKNIYIISFNRNNNEINKIYNGIIKGQISNLIAVRANQTYIYKRIESLSNNNINTTSFSSEWYRIWNNKEWLDGVTGGYQNKNLTLSKIGNVTDKLIISATRYFYVQGLCAPQNVEWDSIAWKSGSPGYMQTRHDGGYILNSILYVHNLGGGGYFSLAFGSDVDVKIDFSLSSSQNSYLKKGGIFSTNNFDGSVGVADGGNNYKFYYYNFPNYLELLVTRFPITTTININKKQLDASNQISLSLSGLTANLGYVDDGGKTIYRVINDSNSGITIDAKGIKFPQTLPSGTYTLNVEWKATSSEYKNPSITGNNGDTIIINYTGAEKDIGTVTFNIDKRFYFEDNLPNLLSINGDIWTNFTTGTVVRNINKFLNVTGNYTGFLKNDTLKTIVNVQNKILHNPGNLGGIKYEAYTDSKNSWDNEVILPVNILGISLKEKLIISKNNVPKSDIVTDEFTYRGESGTLYKGKITEKYIGESAISGSGKVDLTSLNINDRVSWNSIGAQGNIENTNGNTNKKITLNITNGKLFNWKSAVNSTGSHIITKLRITNNGKVSEVTGNPGNLIGIQFDDNNIGFDGNGLYITKRTDKSTPINYHVEAYYQDILLGSIDLTVINTQNIDIGTVTFNVDKRFYFEDNLPNLLSINGDIWTNFTTGTVVQNISELMNVTGNYTGFLKNDTLKTIVNVQNKILHNPGNLGGIKYEAYTDSKNSWDNEVILPVNILGISLKEKLIISKNNVPKSDIVTDEFTYRGESGTLYKGKITEKYIGEKAYIGTANLDLKALDLNSKSTWQNELSTGSHLSQEQNSTLNITTGQLFNTRGIKGNFSIVNKMIVKVNGQSHQISGNIKENIEFKNKDNAIGINGNTGDLYVVKLSNNPEKINYTIELYYGKILLGTLNITIQNGYGFEIIDNGYIDFGHFFPGDIKQGDSLVEFKNPLDVKVDVSLSPRSQNKMIKINSNESPNTTIPIKNILIRNLKDKYVNGKKTNIFKLSATAESSKNTEIGTYKGELEILVTVIPE